MIPVFQRIRHRPDEGIWGNCHRACIASILNLTYEEVPHFAHGGPTAEEFQSREREFLLFRGFVPIVIAYLAESGLEAILRAVGFMNPNTYYILGGTTAGGTPHSVIGFNDKVVHDPNGAGIVGPLNDGLYYITFIGAFIGLHN